MVGCGHRIHREATASGGPSPASQPASCATTVARPSIRPAPAARNPETRVPWPRGPPERTRAAAASKTPAEVAGAMKGETTELCHRCTSERSATAAATIAQAGVTSAARKVLRSVSGALAMNNAHRDSCFQAMVQPALRSYNPAASCHHALARHSPAPSMPLAVTRSNCQLCSGGHATPDATQAPALGVRAPEY